jgi:hypothetical protein
MCVDWISDLIVFLKTKVEVSFKYVVKIVSKSCGQNKWNKPAAYWGRLPLGALSTCSFSNFKWNHIA